MKIKILRGDRGKWYYNTDNIGKEFRDIEYIGSSSFRFLIKGSYWVDKDDCVITELPESFCVKRCDDNNRDDWNKYLQWLNKQKNYPIPMFGGVDRYKYYGVNGENLHSDYLYPFGTEIHIDDIIKHIDFYSEPMVIESKEEKKMETQKLSRQGLKEIHSVACGGWKEILEKYGTTNPLEDYIELTQEQVNTMFNSSTKEQLPIVSKYLKQDDGSVDITKNNINELMSIRIGGEYDSKSFLLSNHFDWEIKEDNQGFKCLIPTKKK